MPKNEKDIIIRPEFSLRREQMRYDRIRFEELRSVKRKRVSVAAAFTLCAILVLSIVTVIATVAGQGISSGNGGGSLPSGGRPADTSGQYEENTEPDRLDGTETKNNSDTEETLGTVGEDTEKGGSIYDYDPSLVPKGEIPIIPMDLSLSEYGSGYINNLTGLAPDIQGLLSSELRLGSPEYLSTYSSPSVLIIHTHGTESYSESGAISYKDDGGEIARSDDTDKNVVAVGRALSEALRRRGINNVHCEIMHDAEGYRNAYANAEETIREQLRRYPTIRLVVDIHRDAVIRSSGELVRPVAEYKNGSAAQIMCVVGSDYGGEKNTRWEANLALALQFRSYLNEKNGKLCRPVCLKASTYNQEIAPYSMLLEIGAAGNSLEEALAVCDVTAEAICAVLFKK